MKKAMPDSVQLSGIAFFTGEVSPILSNPPNCKTKFRFRSQRAVGDVLYWFQNFWL